MIEYLVLNIEYFVKSGKRFLLALIFVSACLGCADSASMANDANMPSLHLGRAVSDTDANKIDSILARLDRKSREIKTYEAKIIYLFSQPVLESESLRTGKLYYINNQKGSKLRIIFTTLKQDNEPVPNYKEEYFFDGVNLTRIDYRLKNVEYRQLTEPNKPLNAFDLASRYLPIIGFAKADKLREDFEISAVTDANSAAVELQELLLKTRSQSPYQSDYKQIRFWVDKQSSLPVRMEAVSPQDDVYDIRLEQAKVNQQLPNDIFNIEVPADFSKNVVPLKD
jgi:outer membrane lipoprotein-sorting protein